MTGTSGPFWRRRSRRPERDGEDSSADAGAASGIEYGTTDDPRYSWRTDADVRVIDWDEPSSTRLVECPSDWDNETPEQRDREVLAQAREIKQLRERIAERDARDSAVRALHTKHVDRHPDRAQQVSAPWFCCAFVQLGGIGMNDCVVCYEAYPCATLRALDGARPGCSGPS